MVDPDDPLVVLKPCACPSEERSRRLHKAYYNAREAQIKASAKARQVEPKLNTLHHCYSAA